jgi:hypothetical protein
MIVRQRTREYCGKLDARESTIPPDPGAPPNAHPVSESYRAWRLQRILYDAAPRVEARRREAGL